MWQQLCLNRGRADFPTLMCVNRKRQQFFHALRKNATSNVRSRSQSQNITVV